MPQRDTIKMADVKIKVVDNAEGNGVIITFADNKGAGYVIKNELKKDTTIPIEKVWEDKYQGTDNYWGKRGKNVDFKIQEKTAVSGWMLKRSLYQEKMAVGKDHLKQAKMRSIELLKLGKLPAMMHRRISKESSPMTLCVRMVVTGLLRLSIIY